MWLVLLQFLKAKKHFNNYISECKQDANLTILTNGAYKEYCYDDPLNEEGEQKPCLYDTNDMNS